MSAEPVRETGLAIARRRQTEATFFLLTALQSVGYITYLLTMVDLFSHTLGSTDVSLLIIALSLLAEALFEVPTGVNADRRGREYALRRSFVWFICHSALYFVAAILPGHAQWTPK